MIAPGQMWRSVTGNRRLVKVVEVSPAGDKIKLRGCDATGQVLPGRMTTARYYNFATTKGARYGSHWVRA